MNFSQKVVGQFIESHSDGSDSEMDSSDRSSVSEPGENLPRRLSVSHPELSTDSNQSGTTPNDDVLTALVRESRLFSDTATLRNAPKFTFNSPETRQTRSVSDFEDTSAPLRKSNSAAGFHSSVLTPNSLNKRERTQSSSFVESLAESARNLLHSPTLDEKTQSSTGGFFWARALFMQPMHTSKEDIYRLVAMERPF